MSQLCSESMFEVVLLWLDPAALWSVFPPSVLFVCQNYLDWRVQVVLESPQGPPGSVRSSTEDPNDDLFLILVGRRTAWWTFWSWVWTVPEERPAAVGSLAVGAGAGRCLSALMCSPLCRSRRRLPDPVFPV